MLDNQSWDINFDIFYCKCVLKKPIMNGEMVELRYVPTELVEAGMFDNATFEIMSNNRWVGGWKITETYYEDLPINSDFRKEIRIQNDKL